MGRRELIDVNEGARVTGLRPQTLYRLAREGRLKSFKVLKRSLRFDRADVLRLTERRTPQTEEA